MDQQPFPPAPRESGAQIRVYRRGIDDKDGQKHWQRLWHFNEKCEGYPTRNFMVQKLRPSDEDLCSRCERASFS